MYLRVALLLVCAVGGGGCTSPEAEGLALAPDSAGPQVIFAVDDRPFPTSRCPTILPLALMRRRRRGVASTPRCWRPRSGSAPPEKTSIGMMVGEPRKR
jgi:hypothetical protein